MLVCSWVCVRIDGLGAMFTAGLAAYLVYGGSLTPRSNNTGFSLNMAVGFSSLILWWIRLLNEFEVSGTLSLHGIIGIFLKTSAHRQQVNSSKPLRSVAKTCAAWSAYKTMFP